MPEEKTDERGASEQAGEEAFETAFTEAAGVGDRPDLHKADDPANEKPDETPVAEKPVEEMPATKPEEKPAEKAEAKPAEKLPEQLPGETDEKYEQRYKTLQGIHKHDRETWEAEKAKLLSDLETATKSPEKKEPTKEEKKAADAFIDSLTDEQKEELKVYEQDFDVVSKMEGIKRKREMDSLRKEIQDWKAEIEGKVTSYDSRIAPVEKLAEDTERETHFNLIRFGYTRDDGTAVPGHEDFEKYRDDGSLLKWIESKPKYLQSALKDTYSKGMATDVIDLFTDFKRDNNITEPESPSAKVVNIKRAEKKQALSSVDSRRGAINTGYQVAQDYDGAFDEALKK